MSKILDSGNRRTFQTGAVRDIQEGKGRCDLLPLLPIYNMLCDDILFVLINLRILVTRNICRKLSCNFRQNLTTASTPCCLRFPSTLSRELRNMVRIIGRKGFLFTATSTAPSVITLNINEGMMTSTTIEPLFGTSCAQSGHAK